MATKLVNTCDHCGETVREFKAEIEVKTPEGFLGFTMQLCDKCYEPLSAFIRKP